MAALDRWLHYAVTSIEQPLEETAFWPVYRGSTSDLLVNVGIIYSTHDDANTISSVMCQFNIAKNWSGEKKVAVIRKVVAEILGPWYVAVLASFPGQPLPPRK